MKRVAVVCQNCVDQTSSTLRTPFVGTGQVLSAASEHGRALARPYTVGLVRLGYPHTLTIPCRLPEERH